MQRDNPLIARKYKSKRWQSLRQSYLLSVNGLCERCKKNGIIKPAYIVHHKIYINQTNYNLDDIFFNKDNLEALCIACHNKEHFKDELGYNFDDNGNLLNSDNI